MTDFFTAFNKHANAALATPEGKAFSANNFDFAHTGGGCTAWRREIDDTGCHILITDSGGTDAKLSTTEPDCWLIGAHGYDGGFSDVREARTVEQAIAIANELHKLVVARDWDALAKGDAGNFDLPFVFKDEFEARR